MSASAWVVEINVARRIANQNKDLKRKQRLNIHVNLNAALRRPTQAGVAPTRFCRGLAASWTRCHGEADGGFLDMPEVQVAPYVRHD